MLKEKLISYYGNIPTAQEELIEKKCIGYTENDENLLFDFVTEHWSKDFGFPDVSKLSKAFKEIPPSNQPRKDNCSVCSECGTKYSSTMVYCPECWKKGKQTMSKGILCSETKIPNVVRFNKEHWQDSEGCISCYNCQLEEKEFCKNFGNPNWNCSEFRNCLCNVCCARFKKNNRMLEEQYGKKLFF